MGIPFLDSGINYIETDSLEPYKLQLFWLIIYSMLNTIIKPQEVSWDFEGTWSVFRNNNN